MRIVILGYLVRGPIGGMAWHHLQYLAGFARLGHDVMFVEDSDDYPSCYDPTTHTVSEDPSYGLGFAADALDRLGLDERWAYFDAHANRWCGPASRTASSFCRGADVVVNVSGVNPLREWTADVPCRVLIDTDPVFTQVAHLTRPSAAERAAMHTDFFTFAECLGSPASRVPDDGLAWRPTRQPVVLDLWTVEPMPDNGAYTTVMQWESYSSVEHGGHRFGMKSESFSAFRRLPEAVSADLEIALGGEAAPRDELRGLGWRLRDPLAVTRNPWTYQDYLRASRGEFSVAKHGYVAARTGWFSERSACYLASGRPVVVQDTGFSAILPTGAGVHAIGTLQEACEALGRIEADPAGESRRAREIAEDYFGSAAVLGSLLERVS